MPCSVCPEEAAKLSVCSRCGIVTYCGKQVTGESLVLVMLMSDVFSASGGTGPGTSSSAPPP